MRKLARERLAAFNYRLAPHILLHALRRRHPRAARLAPARRARNRLFHAELIGQRRSRIGTRPSTPASCTPAACPQPAASSARHRSSESPPIPTRCIHSRSSLIPSLRNVAVHPVPPHARPRARGRMRESAFQAGGRGGLGRLGLLRMAGYRCSGHHQRHECQVSSILLHRFCSLRVVKPQTDFSENCV